MIETANALFHAEDVRTNDLCFTKNPYLCTSTEYDSFAYLSTILLEYDIGWHDVTDVFSAVGWTDMPWDDWISVVRKQGENIKLYIKSSYYCFTIIV